VAKEKQVADNNKNSLSRFIKEQVIPISRAFSETPLTRLRLKTNLGAVTLVKIPPAAQIAAQAAAEPGGAARFYEKAPHAARMHNPQAGRSYDTISADIVGVFRDLPEPPSAGEHLTNGQLIGHIEALRLRHAIRCPVECTLIAQVVVDGQPVDFGEALFVVDSGGVPQAADAEEELPTEPPMMEALEPPRL